MTTYKYADILNEVVQLIDADGVSRKSMLAILVPEGESILPADPPASPSEVSMRQARLALHRTGLLEDVNNSIYSVKNEAIIEWEYATSVKRDSPLVSGLSQTLGLTPEQLDELFILAGSL